MAAPVAASSGATIDPKKILDGELDPSAPEVQAASDRAPGGKPEHSRQFRVRRFLNWFPLGLTYAVLVMGRYNINVAKTALSQTQKLMTNEDFGVIFGVGTLVYAFSFLVNGPLVDRI